MSHVTRMEASLGGDAPARLRELLEQGQLDWDDPAHREMYLRCWVLGKVPERED